jgi:hypothetical protein
MDLPVRAALLCALGELLYRLQFVFCEFKLEVQQNIVCRFAPEGRDVYSLAVLSLLRSSIGAQSLLPARRRFRCRVSLLTERDL